MPRAWSVTPLLLAHALSSSHDSLKTQKSSSLNKRGLFSYDFTANERCLLDVPGNNVLLPWSRHRSPKGAHTA